jgi:hypothetical protein
MKRSLLFFVFFLILSFNSIGQCTPDLSCLAPGANSGYCPAEELDTGTVGSFYSEMVSIKVPEDGTDFGQPLTTIQHVKIVSVDSLAPGLSYTCNPPSCDFPGNSNGCILIQGTPTTVWDHKMTVHAMAYVRIIFVNTTQPQTITGFYSVVRNLTGVESSDIQKFDVSQNIPNPFSNETEISFNAPDNNELTFKVMNMLGAVVYEKRIKPQTGLNSIILLAEMFTPGSYIYSLGNDQHTLIRKMIITRN